MKYILIWIIISQVQAGYNVGPNGYPPIFYYQEFNTYDEALKEQQKRESRHDSIIIYGKVK